MPRSEMRLRKGDFVFFFLSVMETLVSARWAPGIHFARLYAKLSKGSKLNEDRHHTNWASKRSCEMGCVFLPQHVNDECVLLQATTHNEYLS